ncbi:spore germination protein [Bacillus sp. 31A1R]|uniref:Spore germination protein n=1 Tax=Robertmurraya mangrovi TaxID=3098077 RepID=A0ABU5ITM0_9BACI|nr:spore germination protein [Bacillus sp. 31A1R]MDZ5470479.1 spore germination protein [Bacillus sp. 31A1R]
MQLMNEQIKKYFKSKLEDSLDVKYQELYFLGQNVELIYINSICDTDKIQELVVKPFFEIQDIRKFETYLKSLQSYQEFEDMEKALKEVLRGGLVLLTCKSVHILSLKNYVSEGVKKAEVETTIQGPQMALSDDLQQNINMIRHRYHQPSLIVEKEEVGSVSALELMIVYDKKKVDESILKNIKDKINEIKSSKEMVQSAGEFQRLLTPQERTLFPVHMITERVDRVALNISQGKVVLMIEGAPFSLVLPAVFYDFMSSMEDLYQPFWVGKFLVSLRYLGLFISLTLPGAYVAITAYNPEIFKVQLALGVAGSRASVPYPAFLEVIFMLVMMELLTEASIRLPKSIGSTATTVGGLILGQAATEAGLVSNIMIIIVSAVAISNFIIPINEMSFAMRVVKYIILVVSTLGGTIGLIVSLFALIAYLVSLDSFGQPYLRLFMNEAKGK